MSTRTERVARSVQEELGLLLPQLKDPRVTSAGLITITHVRVSADLGNARVLVSLWGDDGNKGPELILGLERSRGFLERDMGRRLHQKRVPHLTFVLDQTAVNAGHIDEVFAELAKEKQAKIAAGLLVEEPTVTTPEPRDDGE